MLVDDDDLPLKRVGSGTVLWRKVSSEGFGNARRKTWEEVGP